MLAALGNLPRPQLWLPVRLMILASMKSSAGLA